MDDSGHLGGVEGWDEGAMLSQMHGDSFIGDDVDGADVEFFNRPPGTMTPTPPLVPPAQAPWTPAVWAPGTGPGAATNVVPFPGGTSYPGTSNTPWLAQPPGYGQPGYGQPGYGPSYGPIAPADTYAATAPADDGARANLLRRWVHHRRRKHAAMRANRPAAAERHRQRMVAINDQWMQAGYRPRQIKWAAKRAGMMGSAWSLDPTASVVDPRYWFKSAEARKAARMKVLAQKKLAASLKERAKVAESMNDAEEAKRLMDQARAADAGAKLDAERLTQAEKAAAIEGSLDPRATLLDPRFWFRSAEARKAARLKILAQKRLAQSLKAQATEAHAAEDAEEAERLMNESRQVDANYKLNYERLMAAEKAAAVTGYFGSDEDRMGAAQQKEWEGKVAADLAAKARQKSKSGGVTEQEAAVLGLEATAHEARAKLCGAEAKAIAGEAVSSIMGDDDALGTWAVVGRSRLDTSSPGAKLALSAAEATPLGMQVRAGRKVAKMANKDPRVNAKVKDLHSKAKGGDVTAKKKFGLIRAGKKADDHKRAAQAVEIKELRRDAAIKRRKAAKARFRLVKFGQPSKVETRLARHGRKRHLAKTVAVVRTARHSRNPVARKRAVAKIKHVQGLAAKGDPKAQATMKRVAVADAIVKNTKTPTDRKRYSAAIVAINQAKLGDPRAKEKIATIQAKAAAGDPKAKKNLEAVVVAAAAESAVANKKTISVPLTSEQRAQFRPVTSPSGLPRTAVPPVPGDARTSMATAAAATALGVPAAAAAAAVMKANAGDPVARRKIDAANRVHAAAQKGDPRAKARIAAVAKGAKAGDPRAQSAAVALAAAVGIKKGRATGMAAPPALRPHVAMTPEAPAEISRGGFSALVQLGPVPGSPFRRYYSGIQRRRHHVAA